MAGETCPYCGKKGLRRLNLHLVYCPKKPLEDVTKEDVEAQFEERAKAAEEKARIAEEKAKKDEELVKRSMKK